MAMVLRWAKFRVTIDGSAALANGIFVQMEREFDGQATLEDIKMAIHKDEQDIFKILAVKEDEDALFDAIKAGAAAFVLKDISPDDLVSVIRRVSSGEYLINDTVFAQPAVASRVLKEFRELAVYGQEAQPIFAPLSPREVQILDNIAQGMTNKQVAYTLTISEQTVKNHMSSILRKLSVNDRTQAVVYAMRQGWIKMPED